MGGIPNYSTRTGRYTSSFQAPSDGFCYAAIHTGAWGVVDLKSGNTVINSFHNNTSGGNILGYLIGFVSAGSTVSISGASSIDFIDFFSMKGNTPPNNYVIKY